MTFSLQSWVVRKKRSKRRGNNKSLFNKLPMELQTDILKRLSWGDMSRAMCVSYPWRDHILHTCLPSSPASFLRIHLFPYYFLGLNQLFTWFSKVMHCKVTPQKLIDSCNGLLLLFHKDGEVENLTPDVYHYYVTNRVTNQCVAVVKPPGIAGPSSPMYSYAALAYDPLESWFFKIVHFQSWSHINVFSSETGQWTTLTFQLPQEVNKAVWQKKSVYSKGAVYRLSSSRHLIKFLVNPQENVKNQAVAIKLPCTWELNNYHWDIGVRFNKVRFFFTISTSLIVWELVERVGGGVHSFEWYEIHKTKHLDLGQLNSYGQLLSYHPYSEIAFFMLQNVIFYHTCVENTNGPRVLPYQDFVYNYMKECGLPLLECSVPFACCLVKKHPRIFQRLPVLEN